MIAVDVLPQKLEWSREFGATHLIDASREDPVAVGEFDRRRLDRRHREGNVAGAFRVRGRFRLRGRHVLIVDDVATSGSTLEATARCLKTAGACWIVALVAGWTPMSSKQPKTPTNKDVFDRISTKKL